jgi:hypothetical protein
VGISFLLPLSLPLSLLASIIPLNVTYLTYVFGIPASSVTVSHSLAALNRFSVSHSSLQTNTCRYIHRVALFLSSFVSLSLAHNTFALWTAIAFKSMLIDTQATAPTPLLLPLLTYHQLHF